MSYINKISKIIVLLFCLFLVFSVFPSATLADVSCGISSCSSCNYNRSLPSVNCSSGFNVTYNIYSGTCVRVQACAGGATVTYGGLSFSGCSSTNNILQYSCYYSGGACSTSFTTDGYTIVDNVSMSYCTGGSGGGGPAVNGACGWDSGQSFNTLNSNDQYLCDNGTTPSSFSGSGPWTWGCNGLNNGTNTASTACSANIIVQPVCGSANGTTVNSMPANSQASPNILCQKGNPSSVTLVGPNWNWTCQ